MTCRRPGILSVVERSLFERTHHEIAATQQGVTTRTGVAICTSVVSLGGMKWSAPTFVEH